MCLKLDYYFEFSDPCDSAPCPPVIIAFRSVISTKQILKTCIGIHQAAQQGNSHQSLREVKRRMGGLLLECAISTAIAKRQHCDLNL